MDYDLGFNEKTDSTQFNFYSVGELSTIPRPRWLIPYVMFQRQIAIIYGRPSSFKSFVVLDMMMRLAHGMKWYKYDLKPARVLYICGEGFPMFYSRCSAWLKHHGLPIDNQNIVVLDAAIDLMDEAEVLDFICTVKEKYGSFDVTVFDTFSTCTAGQNENDSAVATQAIERAKNISRHTGSAALFVHHPGKVEDKGMRGHSGLKGNIDTELHLQRDEDAMSCTFTVTKQKDGPDRQRYYHQATKVKLGFLDEFGEECESLVLTPCEKADVFAQQKEYRITDAIVDRNRVASCIVPGEPMSLNALAIKMAAIWGVGKTKARERLADLLSDEWQRTWAGDLASEIRTVPREGDTASKPILVEVRRKI